MNPFGAQDRESMRSAWRTAWQRHLQGLPLEPLQAQLADVIALHPEYHALLAVPNELTADAPASADQGTDAYLHLSLHLALREQVATDRPRGIAQIHRQLSAAARETHAAEHRMIEVLARTLWEAQRAARMPDEQQYLEALRQL